MVLELIKGVGLLLSLSLLQSIIRRQWHLSVPVLHVLSGLLFGSICVIGMMSPLELVPGVIFDARSVILSMSGLFGGPIVAGIGAAISGGYRYWIGGDGVYVGIATIVLCASLGLVFRYFVKRNWVKIGFIELLVFGVVVHVAEVLLFTQLPADVAQKVMSDVAVPLILTFSPAIVFLGLLLQDIENRLLTDQALRESEQHKRSILDALPDLIWLKDVNGAYLACNPMFERFFGAKESEIRGKTDYDFVDTELADAFRFHDMAAIKSDRPTRNEEEIIFADDGRKALMDTIKTPLKNADGEVVGVLGVARDITEIRDMEERLRHSYKMDAVGSFAGGIAHDVNNMLLPIISLSGMVMKDMPEGSREQKRLEKVIEAAEKAKSIISAILAFSHRDSGPVNNQVVDVAVLIRETIELIRTTLPSSITVIEKIDSDIGSIFCDPSQISAILVNLANNSADAFEGKVGELSISVSQWDKSQQQTPQTHNLNPGRYVRIAVTDNGSGMDMNTVSHVFDPFFTTKEVGKGTGLGLSMAYGIIKKLDGGIDVSSTLGAGSTFSVYLPLHGGAK